MHHFGKWTPDSAERDPLTYAIIGCAIDVHKVLGPGLLESAYEECLSYALSTKGLDFARQPALPAAFHELTLEKQYRPDLIIEHEVVVEIKTVTRLLPVHDAQLLTYLRFSEIERGLIMNFHSRRMISGIRRLILSRRQN